MNESYERKINKYTRKIHQMKKEKSDIDDSYWEKFLALESQVKTLRESQIKYETQLKNSIDKERTDRFAKIQVFIQLTSA